MSPKFIFMKEQLLATLENSQQYSLSVAEMMPANSYDFKPAGAGWTFRELMHHIAYGIFWWKDNYVKGIKTEWEQPAVKDNKQDIIQYLEEAYTSLKNTIADEKLSDDAIKGFHASTDHITHHRGQAVLYLRCKNIAPPEYTY